MPSFGYDPFGGPFREQPWWDNSDESPLQGADVFLESKGWTNAKHSYGTKVMPHPDYEPSDAEWAAIDWLIGEWDFAWARSNEEVEVTLVRSGARSPEELKDLEVAWLKACNNPEESGK